MLLSVLSTVQRNAVLYSERVSTVTLNISASAAEREDDTDRRKSGASTQPHAGHSDSAGPDPTHSRTTAGQQAHSG